MKNEIMKKIITKARNVSSRQS